MVKRPSALNLIAFLLAFTVAYAAQQPAATGDEARLRDLASRFFSAYASRDIGEFAAQWSSKSPDLEVRKRQLQQLGPPDAKFELKNLLVRKVSRHLIQ